MLDIDGVIEYLRRYKYLAMFSILFLCGLGLPIPEEVTLIASGLFVGWDEADFLYSSIACVAAAGSPGPFDRNTASERRARVSADGVGAGTTVTSKPHSWRSRKMFRFAPKS